MTGTARDRHETETLILDAVDKFCRQHLAPADVRRRDEAHTPPYDLIPHLADMGLPRIAIPEAYGGFGLGWSTLCRVQERLAYHAYFAGSILNRIVSFSAMPVIMFGTEAQKRTLVPSFLDGASFMALALTEPGAGSDARAVTTRAVRHGTAWRVTGRKTWISDADRAGYLLALCRTPGEAGGDRSLTTFMIPRAAAGIAMTLIPKVGNNCMPSYDIGLDDVEVPDALRLGEVGEGFTSVTGTLTFSRACMSATVTGCAQAAVDLAVAHARERVQFGRPVAQFQVIKHRLVDMHMKVKTARLMVRELADAIDRDGPEAAGELAAIAKITATEALHDITDHGMQIMASAGYAAESAMQRYWRDARLYTFGEGSSEIQREIIARHMGL
ncbi:MAG: acyl-CoA dehydrogenase family protein [Rhodospirillaceae bacterium]|nr:acyl-CoA dehydrogenase family protein [Rhodospirillaceae bacterium]